MRLRDRRPFIWASRGFAPSSVNMKAASVVGGARGGYGNDRVTGEVTSGSGGSSSSGFAVVAKQSMRAPDSIASQKYHTAAGCLFAHSLPPQGVLRRIRSPSVVVAYSPSLKTNGPRRIPD